MIEIGLQVVLLVKNPRASAETQVWSLGQEDPLEEEMATHSSIIAWKIPWAEEPEGQESMGLQRVGCNWASEHEYMMVLSSWLEFQLFEEKKQRLTYRSIP